MKLKTLICLAVCLPMATMAQRQDLKLVHTSDIDHFWQAYDSIATTSDTTKQISIFQHLYVDRGTLGLHAFMRARDYNARLWVNLIKKYPKFWESIRPNTESVKKEESAITKSIQNFKKLYPQMRPARMYFTVGGLRSGGTTTQDMVLIGSEIATANQHTDASELNDWLKNVFKNQQNSNIVALNVHEYVHTQQKAGNGQLLLSQAIMEGAADFIAELVTQKVNNSAYMVYGRAHEQELKDKFRIEMFSEAMGNWLYNGSDDAHADLGYFMGYVICKSYYNHQSDKRKAIKEIIELEYANEEKVTDFLRRSLYYNQTINKQELLSAFEKLKPVVISLSPNINGQKDVDSSLTEVTINFSEPMSKRYSINYGAGGEEHFPITGVIGYAKDYKSFKLKLALKPGKTYNFLITDKGFKSQAGYPLKPYTVQFEVK